MPKSNSMTWTVSKSLELPDGYQNFSWYNDGVNNNEVYLNSPDTMKFALEQYNQCDLHLYTQHQIFYEDGILKHTRSSPNWEGGLVTYATCKHLMRSTTKKTWVGTWIAGLCPSTCESNCLLFAGRISEQFNSNYMLGVALSNGYPLAAKVKAACSNPRGDVYYPLDELNGREIHEHGCFLEPKNHTRSLEFYKKSSGSVSDRPDGKIPKWWRDIEYIAHGNRPPCFILSPCFLFSKPMVWTSYNPRRAALKLTGQKFAQSLSM